MHHDVQWPPRSPGGCRECGMYLHVTSFPFNGISFAAASDTVGPPAVMSRSESRKVDGSARHVVCKWHLPMTPRRHRSPPSIWTTCTARKHNGQTHQLISLVPLSPAVSEITVCNWLTGKHGGLMMLSGLPVLSISGPWSHSNPLNNA